MPRSPVISRAIAAWVVKDVTTRTGAGGSGVTPAVKASSSGKSRSMSVDLVFVGSDGPDRLEGELVRAARRGDLLPAVLCAQHHPFALPQGERRDELPRDHAARGGLNVVVAQAGDPALAELVSAARVSAQSRRAGARVFLLQGEQLGAQRPLAVQCLRWRPPGKAKLEPADLGPQARVGVRPVACRAAKLRVGGSGQLPEVEQMDEVRRAAGVTEELRIAGAAGDLRHHLVRAEPAERAI